MNDKGRTYEIGSYVVASADPDCIPCASPLGQLLVGARPGEVHKGKIADRPWTIEVLAVHPKEDGSGKPEPGAV